MEIQAKLRDLEAFLIRNKGRQFVDELLEVINESEIDFHPGESCLSKEHLIDIYSTRQEIQSQIIKEEFVKGFEEVISNLNRAQATEFIIDSIDSDNGYYMIVSDAEGNDLMGIFKSKVTLTETRMKYSKHEELVGLEGVRYKRAENIFVKGEPKIQNA